MKEQFRILRLMFVIGSFAPLFILWAIRGIKEVPDLYMWAVCGFFALVPNLIVLWRWRIVKAKNIVDRADVIGATDHREHMVVYLLAMLLPLYDANMNSLREVLAVGIALSVVIVMFWFANLHYLNIFFALFGFRVFTVTRRINDRSGRKTDVIAFLTRRQCVEEGDELIGYRLSHSLWLEKE